MSKPLVTVFIAAYNAELYIKSSLESILNQTYENLEILIIDDGSTDRTCEIIKNYNDKRIKLVNNKCNQGLPYTRNKALELFKGEYFATLDADDIAIPYRIEKQVEFLEKNKNIDVITSDYKVFSKKFSKNIHINKTKENIKISLIFGCCLCNSTSIIRKSSLEKFSIKYNQKCFIAQDYEIWTQFSKLGNIYNMSEVLLKYRIGHENITKKTKTKKIEQRKKIISSIQENLLEYYGFNLNEVEKQIFYDFFSDNSDENLLENYSKLQIQSLIYKLTEINNEKNIFDKLTFKEELEFAVKHRIFNHGIDIFDKIHLYNMIIYDKNILNKVKDITKIILKQLQGSIKKKLTKLKL